jgi:hypothetical protein
MSNSEFPRANSCCGGIAFTTRFHYAGRELPNAMRRSREVNLTVLAAVALSMTACRPEHRDCVDKQNRKEPDSYCEASGGGGAVYHYVYGGSSGGSIGDAVVGGSDTPRGGFGGIGGDGDASGHAAGGE